MQAQVLTHACACVDVTPHARHKLDCNYPKTMARSTCSVLSALFAVVVVAVATAQRLAPVVIPQVPKPYWSWDFIPTAFHGANRSGVFTDEAVALLAQYQVTPMCTHPRIVIAALAAATSHRPL